MVSFYAVRDDRETMSVAWTRFDAEVGHLKRLSAQISDRSITSAPAVLRSQSRRQSAASRRALTGIRSSVTPQVSLLSRGGSEVSLVDSVNPMLSQPRPVVVAISQPCSLNTASATTVVCSASDHICHATVCSSPSVTSHRSSTVADMEMDQDTTHVTW